MALKRFVRHVGDIVEGRMKALTFELHYIEYMKLWCAAKSDERPSTQPSACELVLWKTILEVRMYGCNSQQKSGLGDRGVCTTYAWRFVNFRHELQVFAEGLGACLSLVTKQNAIT